MNSHVKVCVLHHTVLRKSICPKTSPEMFFCHDANEGQECVAVLIELYKNDVSISFVGSDFRSDIMSYHDYCDQTSPFSLYNCNRITTHSL